MSASNKSHTRLLMHYLSAIVAVILAWLLMPGTVQAQYIKHLNARQFLGTSNIYHVTKDRNGFLWFCTNYGLVKYDGHTLEHFARKNGLADNTVFNIYEDRRGRIWPFCYNGSYCFIDGDSVHNEANDAELRALPHTNSFILNMMESDDSVFYAKFSSQKLLSFKGSYIKLEQQSTHQPVKTALSGNKADLLYKVSSGYIVFERDRRLISDKAGLKIYSNDSLSWFIDDPSLSESIVTDLFKTKNEIIVCSRQGLEIIDIATKERTRLLQGIKVSSCTADITGNLWITTIENGLYIIQKEVNNIHHIAGFDGLKWTVVNNGRLIFVKEGRLYELLPEGNKIVPKLIMNNIPDFYDLVMLTDKFASFYNPVNKRGIIQSRNGAIMLKQGYFFKKMYSFEQHSFFAFGQNNTYYYDLDKAALKLKNITEYPDKITASVQDPLTGTVYFLSGNNLYRCNFGSAKSELLYSSTALAGATSVLLQDSSLLITTDKAGYYSLYPVCSKGRLTFQKLGQAVNGLVPVTVSRMIALADEDGFLVTGAGKTRIIQKVLYPFSSSEYEQIARLGSNYLVQLDGQLFYFDTSLMNKHIPASNVYLKRLSINGKDYKTGAIDIRNTTKLDIRLSISLVDFSNIVQGLKYRITGPDLAGEWIRTQATELTFVLRNPGKYRLEISADTENGNFPPIIRNIWVHTPFVRSTAFYFACILLFLLLCGFALLRLLRYREKIFTQELNYLKLEHRAINALLNPHFIFNSINNIQNLIHKAKAQDAADYLTSLSRLIRQNLENLQHNLVPVENELEMIDRYILLQNLRFNNNIFYQVSPTGVSIENAYIPPLLLHIFIENAIVHGFRDKDKPFRIYLSIEAYKEKYLRIVITDNGVGLQPVENTAAMHAKTSFGIAFNRKRLARLSEFYKLHQSITLKDLKAGGGCGLEVEIILFARLKELFEQKHLPVH